MGATNDNDQVVAFSNRGRLLDLLAPGLRIVSSVPGGTYRPLSGTSMSTPHVAGSFALMKQAFPTLSPAQVLQRLQATGTPITYGVLPPRASTVRVNVGAATTGPRV